MAVKGIKGTYGDNNNLAYAQQQQQHQQDCRQYYNLGTDSFEEEFECDEPVDVPIERLKLTLKEEEDEQDDDDRDGEAEVSTADVSGEVDLGGCRDGVGVSLAEELFEAAARQVGDEQDQEPGNSAAVSRSGLFREIFVNNLNNLEEDVTPLPMAVDVVIRSEPLPFDGIGNGYAVATSSGGQKRANSLNPKRILIKKVGMVDEVGLLAACGSCANGGCCIS